MLKFFPLNTIWTMVSAFILASVTFVLTQAAFFSLETSIFTSSVVFILINLAGLIVFNLKAQQLRIEQSAELAISEVQQRAYQAERERNLLNQALNSNMKIMPGMLPKDKFNSIEWLRCIVSENYLSLSHKRKALGENSIDWQVELLRLIQQEQEKENFDLHLSRNQSIQAMNSYLNLLETTDNALYAA